MAHKSVVTDDLETCFICKSRSEELHHCPYGRGDHKQSDKFKLLFPLCAKCHKAVHYHPNEGWDLKLKQYAQQTFLEEYPDLNWMDYFSKNYL